MLRSSEKEREEANDRRTTTTTHHPVTMVRDNPEDITPGGTKKTKKLSQIGKQADSGRRLVEYFCVVSSVEKGDSNAAVDPDMGNIEWKTQSTSYDEEDEFADFSFRPTITARYPLHDHSDNPLHENVVFFCHPSGGIALRTEPIMPKVRTCVCAVYLDLLLNMNLAVSHSNLYVTFLSFRRLTTL